MKRWFRNVPERRNVFLNLRFRVFVPPVEELLFEFRAGWRRGMVFVPDRHLLSRERFVVLLLQALGRELQSEVLIEPRIDMFAGDDVIVMPELRMMKQFDVLRGT